MDALLRPGARISLGAIRALNANGNVGVRSNNRLVLSAYRAAGLGSYRIAGYLRMYSANQKPPPPDSDFDIEKSPFAHLLKKQTPVASVNSTPSSLSQLTASSSDTPASPTESSTSQSSLSPSLSGSSSSESTNTSNFSSDHKDSASPDAASLNTKDIHRNLSDTRKVLSERFSVFMDNVQDRVVHASETLNILTGYTPIEAIKHTNAQLETSLADAQSRVRTARTHYKTMHSRRAATQREVTTLLARKDAWTPADLERFTQLYRTDHEMESQVSQASEDLTEAEADEQRLSTKLNQGILRRYHEEQVWSDRIRRASTWGTWGLMGVNILLFLVLQFIAEPWKRTRLVKGVVEEEKAVLEEVRDRLDHVMKTMEENLAKAHALAHAPPSPITSPIPEPVAPVQPSEEEVHLLPSEQLEEPISHSLSHAYTTSGPIQLYFPMPSTYDWTWEELIRSPKLWRDIAEDLYSEREIDLRMRDATTLVLEGVAFGSALTAVIAAIVIGSR